MNKRHPVRFSHATARIDYSGFIEAASFLAAHLIGKGSAKMSGKSIFTNSALAALAVAISTAALPASAQAQPPGGNERGQSRWQDRGQDRGQSQRSEQRAQPQVRAQAQAQPRQNWSQGQQAQRPDRGNAQTWQGRDGGQRQSGGWQQRDGGTVRTQTPQDRAATPQRGWDGSRWNQTSRSTAERQTTTRDREGYRDNDRDGDRRNTWRNDDNRRDSWQQRESWRRDQTRRDDNRRWDNDNRHSSYRGDYRQWNNDWRRDNRYNWSRYRDSNRQHYRLPRYSAPYRGYSYSRLSIGIFLNSGFYGSGYWINDPWSYRLPQAYGPYRWVRYYDDVLLVDVYSGEVVDVIYDFFW